MKWKSRAREKYEKSGNLSTLSVDCNAKLGQGEKLILIWMSLVWKTT